MWYATCSTPCTNQAAAIGRAGRLRNAVHAVTMTSARNNTPTSRTRCSLYAPPSWAFAPKSFFNDFPFGRGWIAQEGGAYNEHLVRDVGVLFLALIIATAWTALRSRPARPIAVAWFVQGGLHVAYHIGHLDGYKTVDKIGLIGSLALVPVLALVALLAGWNEESG